MRIRPLLLSLVVCAGIAASASGHYRADVELLYEVGRRSVSGNTDRFTLLFRKPE